MTEMTVARRDRMERAVACRLGVHPGIVALYLQYDGSRDGKTRLEPWISECRLVIDGYGVVCREPLLRVFTRVPGMELEWRLAKLLRPHVERLLADRLARTLE